jgi:small subunit ribosomal protein S9
MSYPQTGKRGTGRRKEAVARVRLMKGKGVFLINGKNVDEYLGFSESLVSLAKEPLNRLELADEFDVLVKTHGGGKAGQAGAVRMGLARALVETLNPEEAQTIKDEGYLTRDARVKERKKYGLRGARKRPQFSKR